MQGDRGERPGHRPWMDVEVDTDIGSPPYQAWAELLYGFEDAKWWLDLGDLLAGRPGWHVDLNATGGRLTLLWSFGAFGSSLYNVTAVGPGEFDVFDYDAETNHLITGVDDLRGSTRTRPPR